MFRQNLLLPIWIHYFRFFPLELRKQACSIFHVIFDISPLNLFLKQNILYLAPSSIPHRAWFPDVLPGHPPLDNTVVSRSILLNLWCPDLNPVFHMNSEESRIERYWYFSWPEHYTYIDAIENCICFFAAMSALLTLFCCHVILRRHILCACTTAKPAVTYICAFGFSCLNAKLLYSSQLQLVVFLLVLFSSLFSSSWILIPFSEELATPPSLVSSPFPFSWIEPISSALTLFSYVSCLGSFLRRKAGWTYFKSIDKIIFATLATLDCSIWMSLH